MVLFGKVIRNQPMYLLNILFCFWYNRPEKKPNSYFCRYQLPQTTKGSRQSLENRVQHHNENISNVLRFSFVNFVLKREKTNNIGGDVGEEDNSSVPSESQINKMSTFTVMLL